MSRRRRARLMPTNKFHPKTRQDPERELDREMCGVDAQDVDDYDYGDERHRHSSAVRKMLHKLSCGSV